MPGDTIRPVGWKRRAITAAHGAGIFGVAAGAFGPQRLTVLAYHRIVDHRASGFVGFVGNVSASPAEFAEQMEWAARRFSAVTLDDVADAVTRGTPLPNRALLITFDDGYRDNLEMATPILERCGLPAASFLATDLVGGGVPWWDLVAWCFRETAIREADLPIAGHRIWTDAHLEAFEWIVAAKQLPDGELRAAVDRLPDALEVVVDDGAFAGLMLGWDEVAAMPPRGWQIGAHTRRHPILTRIGLGDAVGEIEGSRRRIADAIGSAPRGFAYPNGGPADFNAAIGVAVADAGFEVAFTLVPGPARRRELSRSPYAIRRVYVHHGDGVARLAAKAGGAARLLKALR